MKNTFCYMQGVVLSEDMKASDSNKNCNGCTYIEFCKRDMGVVDGKKSSRKSRTRKKSSTVAKVDQLTLFDDVEEFIDVNVDVAVTTVTEQYTDFELTLGDVDFGLSDYITEDDLLEARTNFVGVDVIVEYDGWIVDIEDEDTYVTDGNYGIDLSDELPYFTGDELASLGRFRSKYWN